MCRKAELLGESGILADIHTEALGALRVIAEPGRLRLIGELDLYTRGELLAAAAGHGRGGDVRLDASGLTFVDCSGLAALVRIACAIRDSGASFAIAAPSSALALLSRLANTDELLGLAAPRSTPAAR